MRADTTVRARSVRARSGADWTFSVSDTYLQSLCHRVYFCICSPGLYRWLFCYCMHPLTSTTHMRAAGLLGMGRQVHGSSAYHEDAEEDLLSETHVSRMPCVNARRILIKVRFSGSAFRRLQAASVSAGRSRCSDLHQQYWWSPTLRLHRGPLLQAAASSCQQLVYQ